MDQARGHLRRDLKPPLAAQRALIDESCNPAHLLSQELVQRELAHRVFRFRPDAMRYETLRQCEYCIELESLY
jgi:hypothetical protein